VSYYRRWIGALLTMALVVSIGTDCLVGQDMSAEQMACCSGTDHDCEARSLTADCCVSQDAPAQGSVDRTQSLAFPQLVSAPALAAFISLPGPQPVWAS